VENFVNRMEPRRRLLILLGLAGLAVLTYLPALTQPFIADDYGNILLARAYGAVSRWGALASDPVQKYRPIFMVLTYWIDTIFGPWPPAFYLTSILLHVANTWLVFALGVWEPLGWRVSSLAAIFFAVYEGHQEAVMWYSAAYELLLLFFGLTGFHFWVRWLQTLQGHALLYASALVSFALALLSKESAVALIPLFVLPIITLHNNRRRGLIGLIPFVLLALFLIAWVFGGTNPSPRLADGSFSLSAPVATNWLNSYARLLWVWGWLSVVALIAWGGPRLRNAGALGMLWAGISLVPYCFLTYMPRVPSRHTYLASVGVAWAVAAGLLALGEKFHGSRRLVTYGVVLLLLAHNIGYLWVRKHRQYLERAEPTEALVELSRRSQGPVFVHRFPYPLIVAQGAAIVGAGKTAESIVWAPDGVKPASLRDFRFSVGGNTHAKTQKAVP